jgi:DNA excision repair protein ERCC-6
VDLTDDDFSDDGPNSFVNRSGKLQILSKILPLWKKEGHRVLIFCQTRQMLTLIERFVQRRNLTFRRMDGNTAVGARQGLVDRFNNDPYVRSRKEGRRCAPPPCSRFLRAHPRSIFGMLLTTKTGGVGVNFVGANRIILFDPDWNPQTDKQANERAWRFGQKKDVTVYRLITAGTIEEKIYHRQIFKTALSNKILQDPRQRRLFSHNDLKDFFTLKVRASASEARAKRERSASEARAKRERSASEARAKRSERKEGAIGEAPFCGGG